MHRFFASFYRITSRAGFLAVALILALIFWYLPSLLNLDAFRPQLTRILEDTFHCQVLMGEVTGQFFPNPGLIVTHVVFLEQTNSPSVLASVSGVRLSLSPKTLLEGRLRIDTIRFLRPRLIAHRRRETSGESRWAMLKLPQANTSKESYGIREWQIRNGSIEIWDQTSKHTSKWVADQFSGSYQVIRQTGAMAGKALQLGRQAIVDVHYDGTAALPIEARLNDVELGSLQKLTHTHFAALDGSTDFVVKARLQPELQIQITMEPVVLEGLRGARVHAQASFEKNHLHADLAAGTTGPMTLALDGDFSKHSTKFLFSIEKYDALLVREFYHQSWVDRLMGPGRVSGQMQSGYSSETWNWTAEGKNFGFEGTTMRLPEWSAKREAQGFSVYVRATTAEDGLAEIGWNRSALTKDATLEVDVSSVTIRQVLEIFKLQAKPQTRANGTINIHGYEPWRISRGSMAAVIHEGKSLEVKESDIDFTALPGGQGGMHLDLTGSFDLTKINPQAHIQGSLLNIPMTPVVESFFNPPSPITGTGLANFTLAFPLSADWIKGLSGPVQIEVDQGIVRALKTIYKIFSVLNLGNYLRLRLRLPQMTTQGIVFENIIGHLTFQNGILSTDDLFLKSPNMNIGIKGTLDIPGKQLDSTLRLEILRFLEDVLKKAPITHWIFKRRDKIFLPFVVTLEGPWDDVDIY